MSTNIYAEYTGDYGECYEFLCEVAVWCLGTLFKASIKGTTWADYESYSELYIFPNGYKFVYSVRQR